MSVVSSFCSVKSYKTSGMQQHSHKDDVKMKVIEVLYYMFVVCVCCVYVCLWIVSVSF